MDKDKINELLKSNNDKGKINDFVNKKISTSDLKKEILKYFSESTNFWEGYKWKKVTLERDLRQVQLALCI